MLSGLISPGREHTLGKPVRKDRLLGPLGMSEHAGVDKARVVSRLALVSIRLTPRSELLGWPDLASRRRSSRPELKLGNEPKAHVALPVLPAVSTSTMSRAAALLHLRWVELPSEHAWQAIVNAFVLLETIPVISAVLFNAGSGAVAGAALGVLIVSLVVGAWRSSES